MKAGRIYEIIRKTVQKSGYDDKVGDTFANLFRYMNDKRWYGACHATCSVLSVCLTELGYSPQLCIGEAIADTLLFDHSWIVMDKKVVDLAIALPLAGDDSFGPVILDTNVQTMKKYTLRYGIKAQGLDTQAQHVMDMAFGDYMSQYPDEKEGLWGVVKKVFPGKVCIDELKEKYHNVNREYIVY